MRKRMALLVTALMMALAMSFGGAGAAFADSQPQSGQPGLTEGQHGPPPYPNTGDGGGQPQAGQPGLTEGQNGPPPYP
jgi:hypothetical protein